MKFLMRLFGVDAQFASMEHQLSEARKEVIRLQDREEFLRNLVAHEQSRADSLQSVIFERYGITQGLKPKIEVHTKQDPINLSKEPWHKRRARLEEADRLIAEQARQDHLKQTDNLEDYYIAKGAKTPAEFVGTTE